MCTATPTKRLGHMDHRERAQLILRKYGDKIRPLMKPHPTMKYWALLPAVCIVTLAYIVHYPLGLTPFHGMWWFLAWSVGGICSNWVTAALHEIGHNCATTNLIFREILGSLVNMSICVPVYASFRLYHKDHHLFLNTVQDPDTPSEIEMALAQSAMGKFIWLFLMPATYSLRPMIMFPVSPQPSQVFNGVTSLLSWVILIYLTGNWHFPFFLITCCALGLSIHPTGAAHVLAEHYNLYFPVKEHYQTYCYYGPLNYVLFNLGYHAQHHDFPNIPGFWLPKVREIASEFYDDIPVHSSMPKLMFEFIFNPNCGLSVRLDRTKYL